MKREREKRAEMLIEGKKLDCEGEPLLLVLLSTTTAAARALGVWWTCVLILKKGSPSSSFA